MLLSVQQIVCTTNMLMLLFVQQIYLCYCLYNKYDYAIVCTTNMLMLLSVQQIYLRYCLYNKYAMFYALFRVQSNLY